jgi:hypothetical protein
MANRAYEDDAGFKIGATEEEQDQWKGWVKFGNVTVIESDVVYDAPGKAAREARQEFAVRLKSALEGPALLG